MPSDTETLITRAGDGDDAAIGALLDRHLPGLRAYIRLRMGRRLRRWDDEADVAQSVCVEVLNHLDGFSYRGEAAFRQWLFTMARRKLAQRDAYLTAERRDADQVVTNAVAHSAVGEPVARVVQQAFGSPSEVAIRGETLARIEAALDALPEETREVILMSRIAGATPAEIAERLGKPASTIRSTLCRGLAAIGRALA